ncbi:MAG: aminotransferase class I/II-fold pyridoxal phosphate-dependent enzyme [Verrucomicrobia bacterium]|nr:aminotransferase class I/II-fold pyridoxal phosphate-dependent enzyme [Verrucomicrobiota bacterium]
MTSRSTTPNKSRILLSVPHAATGELLWVTEAFQGNWLSTVGPNLDALEASIFSRFGQHAVALSSGTAAIHLGLRLLGVGPGDEVLTPTLTFAASCNPVRYLGATPVFIDSDRATWNLDPGLLDRFLHARARVNRLPKAVCVVHLFGQSADLDPILEICDHYGLPLLEDAAESLGARYKGRHPGTLGQVGAFSFNGNKIITGTSGGMLVSRHREWVEKVRFWSTQARDPDPQGLRNYVHSEIGYNYRLSNVLAGIVRGQLEVLDLRVQQRRAVFERYRRAFADLPGIEPQPEADFGGGDAQNGTGTEPPVAVAPDNGQAISANPHSVHTRWLSCFLVDEAEFGMSAADLIRYLDATNIEARPVWKPMHTQPLYRGYECIGGEVAEDLNRRGICLPSSSSLSEEDQQYVIDCIWEAHRRARSAKPRSVALGGLS